MFASENAALSREIYDAFNRGDFDDVLARTGPDVEIVNISWGTTLHGHDGLREWKTLDPNARVEVIRSSRSYDSSSESTRSTPSLRSDVRI